MNRLERSERLRQRPVGWLARAPFRAFWLLAASASGCSQLVNFEPEQCSSRADCRRFGAEYACVAGLCEVPGRAGGEGSAGAAGDMADDRAGAAGHLDAGTSGSAGGEAGNHSNGEGGAGGNGGTSGEGGQSGASAVSGECTSHKQCFERNGDAEPFACVEGNCVALKSPDCPLVLPLRDTQYNALKSSNAIVLGAFDYVVPAGELNIASQNYDLALTELMDETNGIPTVGGKRRQVVMVVCHSDYPTREELLVPARHLVRDLRVPGIIATLGADDLQYVFDEEGLEHGTFFMGPLAPDQGLLDHGDDGLMWHMVSGPRAVSVTYRPLLELAITHQRNLGVIAPAEAARVALITTTGDRALRDIGTAIREEIRFNGRTSTENFPDSFLEVKTSADGVDGTNDPASVADEILQMKPHVVISAASIALERDLLPLLETRWEAETQGQPWPFYLLSPLQYTDSDVAWTIYSLSNLGIHPPLHRRIAGVTWTSAADRSVYEEYALELEMHYEAGYPITGEYFYDAAYHLLYAAAAAGSPVTGERIAKGMERLMSGPPSYAVGRRDLNAALTTLHASSSNTIQLVGSMGPPAFDRNGARSEAGSVFCFNSALDYVLGGLRYDPDSQRLTGTFPCWAFPALPPG